MAEILSSILKTEKNGIDVDLVHSFMVGDAGYKRGQKAPSGREYNDFSDSDRVFAENLGISFFHARDFFKR